LGGNSLYSPFRFNPSDSGIECQYFTSCHIRMELRLFNYGTDADSGTCVVRPAVMSIDLNVTLAWSDEPGKYLQECCLSSSIRTKDSNYTRFIYFQVYIFQCSYVSKVL
ncbi:MAG: hypothetical protein M1454_01485, partial [Candidatus Thermoplasmatota archaeon]|nr:hypothetical protein [Candidatus Thermoplasmatota archaeon]